MSAGVERPAVGLDTKSHRRKREVDLRDEVSILSANDVLQYQGRQLRRSNRQFDEFLEPRTAHNPRGSPPRHFGQNQLRSALARPVKFLRHLFEPREAVSPALEVVDRSFQLEQRRDLRQIDDRASQRRARDSIDLESVRIVNETLMNHSTRNSNSPTARNGDLNDITHESVDAVQLRGRAIRRDAGCVGRQGRRHQGLPPRRRRAMHDVDVGSANANRGSLQLVADLTGREPESDSLRTRDCGMVRGCDVTNAAHWAGAGHIIGTYPRPIGFPAIPKESAK